MPVTQLENSSELQTVLDSNENVVLDFYSTDCPPCAALAPIYEKVAAGYPDVVFLKMMRQDNRDLAEKISVMGSPTVLFFRAGKLLDKRLCGRITEEELTQAVDGLLNNLA